MQLQQLQLLQQQQQILAMRQQMQSRPQGQKQDRATILAQNKAAADRKKADALARKPVVTKNTGTKKPAVNQPIDVVGPKVATR